MTGSLRGCQGDEVSTRRLIVMRHAKAESHAISDHDRVLTGRGTRDAERVGQYLADIDVVPDHALVSTAVRAVGTWQAVARGAGSSAQPILEESVYPGGPGEVLEAVRSVPAEARVLIVIGHNPAMAALVQMLDDGEGDLAVLNELARGYPTSAVTVFDVEPRWADLAEGCGRVTHFHGPRK